MICRYVTWDQDDKGGASTLYRLLPTPKKMAEVYNLAVEKAQDGELTDREEDALLEDVDTRSRSRPARPAPQRRMPSLGWRMGRGTAKKSVSVADRVLADWQQANSRAPAKKGSVVDVRGRKVVGAGRKDLTRTVDGVSVTAVQPSEDAEVSFIV